MILRLLLGVLLWGGMAGAAFAHGLSPILVHVDEGDAGQVRVRWTLSTQGTGLGLTLDGVPLMLRLPDRCQPVSSRAEPHSLGFRTSDERFECGAALAGEVLVIEGLARSRQPVVLRYAGPGGLERVCTLAGEDDRCTLPGETGGAFAGPVDTLVRYLGIGVDHILGGFDHLAFVLCLAVLAGGVRLLWWPVTAFTLAHSLTLALASLGLVQLPGPPVEACIALSVLMLAVQAAREGHPPGVRALSASAFAFGLLHGLGFAGALADVGFAGSSLALGLLGFNLGVELGQLLVLAAFGGALALIAHWGPGPAVAHFVGRGVAEVAGVAAAYWLIERLWSFAPA